MATVIFRSKGQITIPLTVRKAMGLKTGSRIMFVQNDLGQFSIIPITASVLELKGMLKSPGKFVSIEDMKNVRFK